MGIHVPRRIEDGHLHWFEPPRLLTLTRQEDRHASWLSTRLHRRIPTDPRHLPERWALATLIVLGESVVTLGAGPSVALIVGVLLFSPWPDRSGTVTVEGPHKRGILLKLAGAGVLVALLAAGSMLPPVPLDALLAVTLAAVVFADRTLGAVAGVSSLSWQS